MEDTFEVRDKVAQFASYEEYLDSQVRSVPTMFSLLKTGTSSSVFASWQISELDLYYLDDEELARQLIELGMRSGGDVLKREEFEARKKADREKYLHKDVAPKPLASMGKDLSASPFLQGRSIGQYIVSVYPTNIVQRCAVRVCFNSVSLCYHASV